MAARCLSLDYLSDIGFSVAATSTCKEQKRANANVPSRETKVQASTESRAPQLIAATAGASADLVSPAPVAPAACTLRVLSFNVLFPNSEDSGVWWIYKYYDYKDEAAAAKTGVVDAADWGHRKALLSKLIAEIDADIVCFQEPWNCRGVPKVASDATTGQVPEGEDLVQRTFNADFGFMAGLGYAGELLGKGNIRPATFWKAKSTAAWKPSLQKVSSWHKVSRALVTLFEVTVGSGGPQLLAVANCHLTAGPFPKQRLGTVEDALKAAVKLRDERGKEIAASAPKASKKDKGAPAAASAGPPFSVVICGDFNSEGEQVNTFLREGGAGPDSVLDKAKKHTLPRFVDCGEGAGPTLIVPNVDAKMLTAPADRAPLPAELAGRCEELSKVLESATGRLDEHGALPAWPALDGEVLCAMNELALTPAMLQALAEAFATVQQAPSATASGPDSISAEQVDWWIRRVNGAERGTEFRRARSMQLAKLASAGGNPNGPLPGLTFQEFATVFRLETEEGKFWSLEHDLQALRQGRGLRATGEASYQGRFDRIYLSSSPEAPGLKFTGSRVLACFPPEVGVAVRGDGALRSLQELGLDHAPVDSFVLPNSWHPSDHLPVLAEFAVASVSPPMS